MKNKQFTLVAFLAVIVITFTVLNGCKKKFDEPPYSNDPNITANTTIKDLKALHAVGGAYDLITTDKIISGVVTADDKSGNIYKSLYIQDATGGINILLDATGLYGTYPVGKRLFIYCKGLYLSDYNGLIQLGVKSTASTGVTTMEGIPGNAISNYVVGGSLGNTVTARSVTLATLTTGMQDQYLGDLIQLSGFEVVKGDTSKTWADTSAYKNSGNIYIADCSGTQVLIRSSGYSNFAGNKPPKGNGTIYAIYTVYGTTKQLIIRDTSDVKFYNGRCNLFEEDFNAYAVTGTAALSIPGWKNIMETGDVPYTIAALSGNNFAKVSAFTSAVMPTTNISSWLISPDINIPATGVAPKYSFKSSRRYTAGTFKAYVSTDYNGTNLATATWTLLTTIPAGTATAFTPFDTFGPFDFSTAPNNYIGKKINIAFRYEAPAGTAAGAVGTYEVDDVKISKN